VSRRKQRRAIAAWVNHTRETSRHTARELALTIVHGHPSAMQAYDLGIVLNDDETVRQRTPAHYSYRGEHIWIVQHNSYRGYHSTINNVHQPCTYHAGMLDWLITNHRLAARQPDGQVVSIWWGAIEAITVDLIREIVILDGTDSYHGELRGPAIAPIAVAAIAICHGPQALLEHPALELLRAPPNAAGDPATSAIESAPTGRSPSGSERARLM
jgi:hypothetical protein